jgi:hypothetical protein
MWKELLAPDASKGNGPMPTKGHGIEKAGRNEEQPADKERAQDSSSPTQDKEQGKD